MEGAGRQVVQRKVVEENEIAGDPDITCLDRARSDQRCPRGAHAKVVGIQSDTVASTWGANFVNSGEDSQI